MLFYATIFSKSKSIDCKAFFIGNRNAFRKALESFLILFFIKKRFKEIKKKLLKKTTTLYT